MSCEYCGSDKKQFDLWLEAEQRRAVVDTRIRELESEMIYLNDVIATLKPKEIKLGDSDD